MIKDKKNVVAPTHSVSIKGFGLTIDGQGLGGVIAVPAILLIIALAGAALGNGAAWLARLSAQSNAINEAAHEAVGPKDS